MAKNMSYSAVKGMYSMSPSNNKKGKNVPTQWGPNAHPDAQKANQLLQRENAGRESVRGKGMM